MGKMVAKKKKGKDGKPVTRTRVPESHHGGVNLDTQFRGEVKAFCEKYELGHEKPAQEEYDRLEDLYFKACDSTDNEQVRRKYDRIWGRVSSLISGE